MNLSIGDETACTREVELAKHKNFSLQNFVEHIVPKSAVWGKWLPMKSSNWWYSPYFLNSRFSMGIMDKPLIKPIDVIAHVVLKDG